MYLKSYIKMNKILETIIKPVLEILFWVIIIFSIIVPNSLDAWLR